MVERLERAYSRDNRDFKGSSRAGGIKPSEGRHVGQRCFNCGQKGHVQAKCPKRKGGTSKGKVQQVEFETEVTSTRPDEHEVEAISEESDSG